MPDEAGMHIKHATWLAADNTPFSTNCCSRWGRAATGDGKHGGTTVRFAAACTVLMLCTAACCAGDSSPAHGAAEAFEPRVMPLVYHHS